MLKRLKHHPSIIAWCGGNEAAMWHDQEYDGQLRDRGDWPGLVAAKEVGQICQRMDPTRYYQPSSPYYGIDPNDPREGNTHGYTNMWFVPGYDYLNFASEDTRIAAPVLHSLQRFMKPEDIWPDDYSPVCTHGNCVAFSRDLATLHDWQQLEEDRAGRTVLRRDGCGVVGASARHGRSVVLPGHHRATAPRQSRHRYLERTALRRLSGLEVQ